MHDKLRTLSLLVTIAVLGCLGAAGCTTARATAAEASVTQVARPTHPGRVNALFRLEDIGDVSRLPPGVQRLHQLCGQEHATSCLGLGALYEQNQALKEAMGLYDLACNLGQTTACYNIGVMFEKGLGVSASPSRALRYYEYACAYDEPRACSNMGLMFENGIGTNKNMERAAELMVQGCGLSAPMVCSNLARHHRFGLGVPQDLTRAIELYDQSCADGYRRACPRAIKTRLIWPLCEGADDYHQCSYSAQTLTTMATQLAEACSQSPQADEGSCLLHAMILESGCGDWFDPDGPGANQAGLSQGCGRAPSARELVQANAAYEYWCEQGSAQACNNLGNFKRRGQGGHTSNLAEAQKDYRRACDGGFVIACADLGSSYLQTEQVEEALTLMSAACERNIDNCLTLDALCIMLELEEELEVCAR